MSCQQTRSDDGDRTLDLLGDPYVVEILTHLADGPATAIELTEGCSGSKPTVYRRLDRLAEAGFVRSRLRIRDDGNHCQVYRLAVDTLTISITDDGITTTIDRDGLESATDRDTVEPPIAGGRSAIGNEQP